MGRVLWKEILEMLEDLGYVGRSGSVLLADPKKANRRMIKSLLVKLDRVREEEAREAIENHLLTHNGFEKTIREEYADRKAKELHLLKKLEEAGAVEIGDKVRVRRDAVERVRTTRKVNRPVRMKLLNILQRIDGVKPEEAEKYLLRRHREKVNILADILRGKEEEFSAEEPEPIIEYPVSKERAGGGYARWLVIYRLAEMAEKGEIDPDQLMKIIKEEDYEGLADLKRRYFSTPKRFPVKTLRMLKVVLEKVNRMDDEELKKYGNHIARSTGVCPRCGSKLEDRGHKMVCPRCRAEYTKEWGPVKGIEEKDLPVRIYADYLTPIHLLPVVKIGKEIYVNPHHPLIRLLRTKR